MRATWTLWRQSHVFILMNSKRHLFIPHGNENTHHQTTVKVIVISIRNCSYFLLKCKPFARREPKFWRILEGFPEFRCETYFNAIRNEATNWICSEIHFLQFKMIFFENKLMRHWNPILECIFEQRIDRFTKLRARPIMENSRNFERFQTNLNNFKQIWTNSCSNSLELIPQNRPNG